MQDNAKKAIYLLNSTTIFLNFPHKIPLRPISIPFRLVSAIKSPAYCTKALQFIMKRTTGHSSLAVITTASSTVL